MIRTANDPTLPLWEATLFRSGVSAAGARECLAAQPITLLADRQRLAEMAMERLGFTTEQRTSAIALLIPAVQSARVARPPRSTGSSAAPDGTTSAVDGGFTSQGVTDLLAGRTLINAADREHLARLIATLVST
jgi:hypothetical protein